MAGDSSSSKPTTGKQPETSAAGAVVQRGLAAWVGTQEPSAAGSRRSGRPGAAAEQGLGQQPPAEQAREQLPLFVPAAITAAKRPLVLCFGGEKGERKIVDRVGIEQPGWLVRYSVKCDFFSAKPRLAALLTFFHHYREKARSCNGEAPSTL